MARFLLSLVAAAALTAVSTAQWTPQGSITSRQYQNQIREGGQVVATEFFSLEYSVDTWIEDKDQKKGPHMVCDNKCRGMVHEDHSKCDYSCDDRCTERHRTTVRGEYRPDRAAMNQATRDANALALQGGGSHSPSDWSHRVSTALAAFRREARKSKTFTMQHAAACSGMDHWVGTKTFDFHVRGTMKKVGYSMSRGVRTPINQTVGTHEKVVASADIVQEDPLEQIEWTKCRCKGKEAPVDMDAVLDAINRLFDTAVFQFGEKIVEEEMLKHSIMSNGTGLVFMSKSGDYVDPGESKVTVKPADMNRCAVEIENGTGTDVQVTIPVGTMFEAANGSEQNMGSMVVSTGMLFAGQTKTFYVSLSPQPQQTTAQFPVRWACLNMAKKEPGPNSRYTMRAPQDDVLLRLGAITNSSRIRGPHDQARVWIYTDKATMEDVNERMLPGVSEGRYLSLLWEVATVGGVDVTAREYQRCLDPKLLAGIPLDDRATAWLVSTLGELKARDLARYVDSNATTIARLVQSDAEYGPAHVATLATALLDEENADVRKAGLKLVASVPAAVRSQFANAGGLAGIRSMLASGNTGESSSALDVLIAYGDAATELLGASWEQLPTDALKEKARRHLGIE